MNTDTQEQMAVFTTPEGDVVFRMVHTAADFSHVAEDKTAEAYAIMSNLVIGLNENKDMLSLDSLHVIKNSLFEKFAELGVPAGLIQPMLGAFQAVDKYMLAQSYFETAKRVAQ